MNETTAPETPGWRPTPRTLDTLPRRIGAFFFGIGVVMLLVSVLVHRHISAWRERSRVTEATVVELLEETSVGNSTATLYRPVYRFTPEGGDTITVESNARSTDPGVAIGDKVAMRYDPENPTSATRDSFFSIWLGFIVTLGIGILFAIFGAVFLAVTWPKRDG